MGLHPSSCLTQLNGNWMRCAMPDLLIRNSHVLLVSQDGEVRVLRDHDIAIEGNRISAVEPSGTIPSGPAREIIEADGMVAMPGLINTHIHAAGSPKDKSFLEDVGARHYYVLDS